MTTASFDAIGSGAARSAGAGAASTAGAAVAGAAAGAGARLAKAFELWKFDALTDPCAARSARQATPPPPEPAVLLNQIRETAKTEGYQAGLRAGRVEGKRLAAAEAAHLGALLDGVTAAVSTLQDEVGAAVLDLAFNIARQVLRTELVTQPEAILPAIREALDLAGSTAQPGAAAQLLLCPLDAALVRAHLHDLLQAGQWRITADPAIAAGGCRIVTGSGAIDATLATRWQRVSQALGRDDVW